MGGPLQKGIGEEIPSAA